MSKKPKMVGPSPDFIKKMLNKMGPMGMHKKMLSKASKKKR